MCQCFCLLPILSSRNFESRENCLSVRERFFCSVLLRRRLIFIPCRCSYSNDAVHSLLFSSILKARALLIASCSTTNSSLALPLFDLRAGHYPNMLSITFLMLVASVAGHGLVTSVMFKLQPNCAKSWPNRTWTASSGEINKARLPWQSNTETCESTALSFPLSVDAVEPCSYSSRLAGKSIAQCSLFSSLISMLLTALDGRERWSSSDQIS